MTNKNHFPVITIRIPDHLMKQIDLMVSEGKYANRTALIIEAVADFITKEKQELRAFEFRERGK